MLPGKILLIIAACTHQRFRIRDYGFNSLVHLYAMLWPENSGYNVDEMLDFWKAAGGADRPGKAGQATVSDQHASVQFLSV